MSTVTELILAAFAEDEKRRAEEQAKRDRLQAAVYAKLDADAMKMVTEHPWLNQHLPGITWVLIERVNTSPPSVLVHPAGEPHLRLRVPPYRHMVYMDGQAVHTLADLGRIITQGPKGDRS